MSKNLKNRDKNQQERQIADRLKTSLLYQNAKNGEQRQSVAPVDFCHHISVFAYLLY